MLGHAGFEGLVIKIYLTLRPRVDPQSGEISVASDMGYARFAPQLAETLSVISFLFNF